MSPYAGEVSEGQPGKLHGGGGRVALKDMKDPSQQTIQSKWAEVTAMEDKEGLSGQEAEAGSPGRA